MATIAPADSKIGQQIARITNAKKALADYLKNNTDLATENMSINELVEAILALIGQKGAYNIVQNLLDDGNSELVITDASGSNANELDSFITREISGVYTNDRITKVGLYGLGGCENLTSINLPNVVTVGDSGFYNCKLLKNVFLPKLTTLGKNGFNSTGLESINLPLCTKLGVASFSQTNKLVVATLPLVTSLEGSCFSYSSVQKIDTSSVISIGAYAFGGAQQLDTLILRNSSVCTLANSTNTFTNTKITAGTGYIYVPDNLVDSYKTATNWVTFANQIKPISELEGTT
jgi:hypothetical protein